MNIYVRCKIETVAESVNAPKFAAVLVVKVFERGHRLLWGVGKRRKRDHARDRAALFATIRFAAVDACRKSPAIFAEADTLIRICDAIRAIDQSEMAIIFEVIRVTIFFAARIEAHERKVREEKIAAGADAHVELDAEVGVTV